MNNDKAVPGNFKSPAEVEEIEMTPGCRKITEKMGKDLGAESAIKYWLQADRISYQACSGLVLKVGWK